MAENHFDIGELEVIVVLKRLLPTSVNQLYFICTLTFNLSYMKDNHFNFEDLKVYQKSLEFQDTVYKTTLPYPPDERFNLVSQFRRASLSLSLNIAEGSGATNKENIRYLDIASRSLKECVVCTTCSLRREYIDQKQHDAIRADMIEIKKMIAGLISYLRKSGN